MLNDSDHALLIDALESWADNACYLDGAGNYRLKTTRRVAPWNRAARRAFPDSFALHEAAERFKPHAHVFQA